MRYSGSAHVIRGSSDRMDATGRAFLSPVISFSRISRSFTSAFPSRLMSFAFPFIATNSGVISHAFPHSCGSVAMNSRRVSAEAFAAGMVRLRASAARRAASLSSRFRTFSCTWMTASLVRETCISRLRLLIRRFCSPRSVSMPRFSIAQAAFPR